MRKQFRDTVTELAEADERVVLVFGDISVFLFEPFVRRFPNRFYNLGICENTLVSVAAGLASQGLIPFVHTIAPFVTERCLEQIKIDVGYNRFPINIVTCGATYDYAWDGPTHQALADMGALRLIPDIEIVQPGTRQETDRLLRDRYASGTPTYFRLSDHPHGAIFPVEFARGVVVRDVGGPVTVVTAGPILANVLPAVESLPVNVIYFSTIKPLDGEILSAFAHTRFLVVHDATGLFEEVCEHTAGPVTRLGLPDRFVSCYGTIQDIRREIGLDPEHIRHVVSELLSR
ncbi:MAG: transketolase C-terminal domain-containing protein [Acidobacteriota bacterium]